MSARRITPEDASMRLTVPECQHGIGDVIVAPDSDALIEGVRIEEGKVWPDDRGYFLEIARMGAGLAGELDAGAVQTSAALSYPATIKAFHYHLEQTDYWAPVAGMFQVALVDFRENSPTFGRKNTLYVGALRPWRLWIPPGVGHGYKVIGEQPGVLVYLTSNHYNPADEGRIPYNEPGIDYDWELQHK